MTVTVMEIVLLIISIICFAVSFLLPEKKPEGSGIDQELAREEVKEMVRQEVEGIRGHVDDVVKESMDYAMEKTERSLERLSNEKIMAVNEYSDSVMQEIHKNHEEVVFLYDMLNVKHDSLKKTVAEASKAAKVMQDSVESIQSFRPVAVSYGEGSVRIAPLASKRRESAAGEGPGKKPDEKEAAGSPGGTEKQEREARESLRTWKPEVKPYAVPDSAVIAHDTRPIFAEKVPAQPGEMEELHEIATDSAEDGVTDGEPSDEASVDENGRNNNDQILELHRQGKSNVDIARELGLGVGEVKLVIDLFQKM